MLVIVASRYDKAAQLFAEQWGNQEVGVLTSQDLSLKGWRHDTETPEHSQAVVDGRAIAAHRITAVVTRLPAVLPTEIPQIVPRDRSYVAAEMTAFLSGWLNTLTCPVLNRPTATCLMGPNWSPQQWILTATQLGIPVEPLHQTVALESMVEAPPLPAGWITVTVVGDRTVGEGDPQLIAHARRLATAAGVDLLTVYFSNATAAATFVKAELWADLTQPAIATALWNYITGNAP